MKIKNIRTISGPNVYHRNPVLMMTLDLEERADVGSHDLPGFTERLVALLPGLDQHRCSPGRPGGFIERLHRGTYLAHIIEHVALELTGPAGIEVGYGKSIYGGAHGIYNVIVRYRAENAMRFLLEAAVDLVKACADGLPFDVKSCIERAKEIAADEKLGPSTRAIVDAAERRGIPWRRMNDQSLIEFGYGSQRKTIQATITGASSHLAVETVQDKDRTKSILARIGVPVPRGEVVYSVDEALAAFRSFDGPVALKPRDGNHGNGVCLDLRTEAAIREAFPVAREYSHAILIEDFFRGKDFRALVVGGKLVAVSERTPARVIGDGAHSVAELIEIENRNPLRGEGHEKPITKITIDAAAEGFLRRSGIRLDAIPEAGVHVPLRNTANLSKGGTATDVTDDVHPEIRMICERAARAVGLDVCGVDLIAEDIRLPLTEQRGAVIEMNAAPGIRMHHYPAAGNPRDAGAAIIEHLFPHGASGRIPIVSITGTNGKTTVTRMIGHLLHDNGKRRVGMTTSSGVFLGKTEIARGDTTGPASARMILEDPWVDFAVLETARGGILRRGLGYDWSDVGIVTNVQADHIGQDGIETIDDILKIKALIAERVREGGTLVLNAEDERVAGLADRPSVEAGKKRVVFFALDERNPILQRHLRTGGRAYFPRRGMLIESQGGIELPLAHIERIPATVAGTADYQIANALAAAAAARALGLLPEEIQRGLGSFHPNTNNSGRGNFYRAGKGLVMIDYGHNPEALNSVGRMLRRWNVRRTTGIISAPGDRSDEMIRASGFAAAHAFDRVIIREDVDLRGRAPAVTAGLLCDAVHEARPEMECHQRLDEPNALESAVAEMIEGEAIVFFYDDLRLVTETLARIGATPVQDLSEIASFIQGGDRSSPTKPGLKVIEGRRGNVSEVS